MLQGNPVLILKGTCNESPLDWLYYIEKDENQEIFYEGYKTTTLVQQNDTWQFLRKDIGVPDMLIKLEGGQDLIPLGRHNWKTINTACKQDKMVDNSLALTACVVGEEFSCDSGRCVSIFQRCDNNEDCLDGSDEKDCNMLRIPPSYEKSTPPDLQKDLTEANPIFTQIDILNIDFVDTVSMSVGVTVEIHLTWRDRRLIFQNILDGKEKFDLFKVIAKREIELLWLPMPEIIHDNAVLGKEVVDKVFYVKIVGKSNPEKVDLEESIESLLYQGLENDLTMNQRFKLEYRCEFFVRNYPFDEQTCSFILMMNIKGNNSLKFMESIPPIIYDGPKILTEFELTEFFVNTTLTEFETRFVYNMKLTRLYMQALLTTFFQSFLLWLIAYLTLFINIVDFANRFMGALTSLLVLAALLTNMNSSLPQTAYFKHIDIWFFFFVINIALVVFIHIFVDIFLNWEKDFSACVTPSMSKIAFEKPGKRKKSTMINQAAKVIIAVLMFIFVILYFWITINK